MTISRKGEAAPGYKAYLEVRDDGRTLGHVDEVLPRSIIATSQCKE
jgi:hypothetical protein